MKLVESDKCLPFFFCQTLDNYWPYKKKEKQRSPRKLLCFSQISDDWHTFFSILVGGRVGVFCLYLAWMGWCSVTVGSGLKTGLLMAKFHTYKGKQHFSLPIRDEPNYAHSCVTHEATRGTVWLSASFPRVLYHGDETSYSLVLELMLTWLINWFQLFFHSNRQFHICGAIWISDVSGKDHCLTMFWNLRL